MNYRSVSDLNSTIISALPRLPRDIDVVVGIPRSGLLAANIIALHLNLPLADLEGFLAGKVLSGGERLAMAHSETRNAPIHALIVDDSIASGRALSVAKEKIRQLRPHVKCTYFAVFATNQTHQLVDLWGEQCALPRVFEWNIMNHRYLAEWCVDIDGVLCRDPTDAENDDGLAYARFVQTVEALYVPTIRIGHLVTCRLEKYREQTVAWLSRRGIRYDCLHMLDLPDGAARRRWGRHAEFKGSIYRQQTKSELFIESSASQASKIANVALKPVYCIENREMILPHLHRVILKATTKFPVTLARRTWFAGTWLGRRLFSYVQV